MSDGPLHLRQVLVPECAKKSVDLPFYYYAYYDLRHELKAYLDASKSSFLVGDMSSSSSSSSSSPVAGGKYTHFCYCCCTIVFATISLSCIFLSLCLSKMTKRRAASTTSRFVGRSCSRSSCVSCYRAAAAQRYTTSSSFRGITCTSSTRTCSSIITCNANNYFQTAHLKTTTTTLTKVSAQVTKARTRLWRPTKWFAFEVFRGSAARRT